MKKRNLKKSKNTKKSTKNTIQKKSSSRLLPRLIILLFFLCMCIGITSQKPITIQLVNNAPALPKQLSLRVSPTPILIKPATSSQRFVAKAQAADDIEKDFCLNIPILFYHHVEPMAEAQQLGHAQFTVDSEAFDQQMRYLQTNGYKTASIDTVVDSIMNRRQLDAKTVALTFDDGFVDMYTYAYPLLKKYNFVGNFAIPAGLLETPDYLTWAQLTEIAQDPHMHVYNHSYSHAGLKYMTVEKIVPEVTQGQRNIQEKLGLRSNIFFYPFGEFNNQIIEVLKANGYIAAFSTLPGTLQCESALMTLHRTRIGNAPLSFYGL